MISDKNSLKSILERMSKVEVECRDTYEIDGKRIPRVTEVLSAMLHEDGLMSWANGLGWKRISYRAFMNEAASKGTYSHLAIEKYLRRGSLEVNDMELPNDTVRETVLSVMDGFTQWWSKIHKEHQTIEVVYLEEHLLHEYFGGTCDCLLKVDGEYWLIDFKTSNHMNYNYSLQLSAYRFLLRELKGINISRAIVLIMSKTEHSYQSYELDLKNKDHLEFIENCEYTFLLLVAAYRMRLYTTEEYHNIYGIKKYKK